jgi:SAM-dependent methyltransferase
MTLLKALKYPDLETIYRQCSGPGGLKLAEFLADKLDLQTGQVLLDVGFNRGYQTCFLAKEYLVFVVGIDPWPDRSDGRPHVEHLMENARAWGVERHVLGVQVGLPDTRFAGASFDAIYTSTTMEMIRGSQGEAAYRACLGELFRLLRPGGRLALGEPMHFDLPVPPDLAPLMPPGNPSWVECFSTVESTVESVRSQGFAVLEADYAPDARQWWLEYAAYDPGCRANPQEEPRAIAADGGRWLTFGYVIAQKPGGLA